MRKALCVGINYYQNISNLTGCAYDANTVKTVLERNSDNTRNFDVKLMCATNNTSSINRGELKDAVEKLFQSDVEIALFYFAGHGSFDSCGGYLCTSECSHIDDGLSLNDLMRYVSQSHARNKIIILDSCHSGAIGENDTMQHFSTLSNGTTILAACNKHESALECNGHGIFTELLVEALNGGSMTLLGDVTPGSIYAYIDRSLGAWDQRPIFKANISSFVSLRKCKPLISVQELHELAAIFEKPDSIYPLDPSYEPNKNEIDDKTVNEEHQTIFALLQKGVKQNLVVPWEAEHMYYAALNYKGCKLTAQGQHYWKLIKKGTV